MIDTSSVEAFSTSLSAAPREVERILSLKMRLPDAISPAAASLAQRGYLGCLPFAHMEADEIVLRLLPKRKLTESPVALAWWSYTEGETLAPNLNRFVAGRMAQVDIAHAAIIPSEEQRQQLLQFAAEFGDTSSTKAVLEALDEVRSIEEASARMGHLWNAAGPDDPLCQALTGAWALPRNELGKWLDKAIHEIPEVDIVKRLYVAYHVRYKTGVDVSEIVWQLIIGDNVFDPSYISAKGPTRGAWDKQALVYAVKWLANQGKLSPAPAQLDLWQAAQALASAPLTYEGAEHFAAAQKIAPEDPLLAYTHTANAAAYYARVTELTPIKEIVFAHELAVEHGWEEVRVVLEWARSEMDI